MRLNLILDERTGELLTALLRKYGGKPTEFLRGLIRERYETAFPSYKMKSSEIERAKEPELTPEQWCESVGGKCDSVNKKCLLKMGGATYGLPYGDPVDMKKAAENRGFL